MAIRSISSLEEQLATEIEKPNRRSSAGDPDSEPSHEESDTGSSPNATVPRQHGGMTPRNHTAMIPSTAVEQLRKAVFLVGKEAATHRFTPEEKGALADIVYGYRRLGYKTSENELTRIAINWLVGDYNENGPKSVLDQVLKSLKE